MANRPQLPPIGLPAARVLVSRYDDFSDPIQTVEWDTSFNYGHPHGRIPRLWNVGLGSLAGLYYSGWRQHNDQIKLSPPPIIMWGRGERSVRLANAGGWNAAADRINVPAIYVGWNGGNA